MNCLPMFPVREQPETIQDAARAEIHLKNAMIHQRLHIAKAEYDILKAAAAAMMHADNPATAEFRARMAKP